MGGQESSLRDREVQRDKDNNKRGGQQGEGRSIVHSLFVLVDTNTSGTNGLAFHRIKRLSRHRFFTVLEDFRSILKRKIPRKVRKKFVKFSGKTYSAYEAVRMELAVERWNVILHNGAIAAGALWREHVEVVVAAVRLSVAFMEAIVAELLTALGAEEVLGMPGLVKRCHAFLDDKKLKNFKKIFRRNLRIYIQNRPVAVSTPRTEQIVVIGFAVRRAFAFKEVSRAQLLVAVIASEMLWMPSLAQRRDDLTDNRLVACTAAAFLHCVDSLTWHILLKTAKHILELVLSWFVLAVRCLNDGFFTSLIVGDALGRPCVVGYGLLLLLLLLRWINLSSKASGKLWNVAWKNWEISTRDLKSRINICYRFTAWFLLWNTFLAPPPNSLILKLFHRAKKKIMSPTSIKCLFIFLERSAF